MGQTEETLERMTRAQKMARIGTWDQDPVSGQLWWSDETYSILGIERRCAPPDFNRFICLVHPDDRCIILNRATRALMSEDTPYQAEYRITRSDHTERIIHEKAVIKRDKNGLPSKITGIIQDITERRKTEIEREKRINELEKTIESIKTISGCIPICSCCKNIRDSDGYWSRMEVYIQNHSDVLFSHSICEKCAEDLYPGLNIRGK